MADFFDHNLQDTDMSDSNMSSSPMKIKRESSADHDIVMSDAKDDGTLSMDTRSSQELLKELEEINNALEPVPQKRGRLVGSGAGEKRKEDHEYSKNPHTVRANKRRKNMTAAQAELHRVKANLASAKSKVKKKVKSQPGFADLPKSVQLARIQQAQAEVESRKEAQGYTESWVRTRLESKRDAYEEELRQREAIAVQRIKINAGDIDDDDEIFWEDIDDEDDDDDDRAGQDDIDASRYGDLIGAIQDSIDAVLAGNTNQGEAFDLATYKYEKGSSFDPIQNTLWVFLKSSIFKRLVPLAKKEGIISQLGRDAESQGWLHMLNDGYFLPTRFFTASDRALLRFAMANLPDDHEWIDLPGPAVWWPDSSNGSNPALDRKLNAWYIRAGFDYQQDWQQDYRKAAEMIRQNDAPKDFADYLVHNDLELIWQRFWD